QVLEKELREVADLRLEERENGTGQPFLFYFRAVRQGLDDIGRAVVNARPWMFPLRLSRLTAAAFSTLLILLMTGEAWALGMSQKPALVTILSLIALAATTVYVLKRQRLLVHRRPGGLTEQAVIANVSISISVLLGLAVTYAALFLLVLAVSLAIYPGDLVEEWATLGEGGVVLRHYLVFAGFIANLGIVIGSLGASFEEQQYFRHISYVDEET
ncbi:MAG: hypothetical protein ACLGI9_05340, partial [Thermoanaerobaculia bacterium]